MTTRRARPVEYADPRHEETPEPSAAPLGFSAFDFGFQRYGDAESRCGDFAEAGDEGPVAVSLLLADGAFSSHERFDDVQDNETIGGEPMPDSGFEHSRPGQFRR